MDKSEDKATLASALLTSDPSSAIKSTLAPKSTNNEMIKFAKAIVDAIYANNNRSISSIKFCTPDVFDRTDSLKLCLFPV